MNGVGVAHLRSRYRGPAHDAACSRILCERDPGQLRGCAVPHLKKPIMTPLPSPPSRLFGLVGSRILTTGNGCSNGQRGLDHFR